MDSMNPISLNQDLINCAINGDVARCRELFTRDEKPNPNFQTEGGGLSSLHFAAQKGNWKLCSLLITHGASVDLQTKRGETPLYKAAENGRTEAAEVLLNAGADLELRDENGFTPLHAATMKGNAEITKALIKGGADVNAKDKNNCSPLHFPYTLEVTTLLLKAGANTKAKSKDGLTPAETLKNMKEVLESHGLKEGNEEIDTIITAIQTSKEKIKPHQAAPAFLEF
jgi:cytohesin